MSTKTAPSLPVTASARRAGRWLVASAVTFVAGYALAILAPEGTLIGNLSGLPLVAAGVLLVTGTAAAARLTSRRPLAIGAVVAAAGCAAAMTALIVMGTLAEIQQLPLEGWFMPVAIVASAFGGAAVAALAVALRADGFARRTALVVAVLGAVTLLGCFFVDPVVPFVLAGVLGVPLARFRASATM